MAKVAFLEKIWSISLLAQKLEIEPWKGILRLVGINLIFFSQNKANNQKEIWDL
jgi:hypothetical protein